MFASEQFPVRQTWKNLVRPWPRV